MFRLWPRGLCLMPGSSLYVSYTRKDFNEIISQRNNIFGKIMVSSSTRKHSNEKLQSEMAEDIIHLKDDYKQKLIRLIKAVFKLR